MSSSSKYKAIERAVIERELGGFRIIATDRAPVPAGETAAMLEELGEQPSAHNCMDNAVPYVSDGPLGHGWECGVCGEFLQAG